MIAMPDAQAALAAAFRRFSGSLPLKASGRLLDNGSPTDRGDHTYIPTEAAKAAVDVALGLGKPLLVSGEPGVGKTELGFHVARALGVEAVHSQVCKSTTEATGLLYEYDALRRLRKAQHDAILAQIGAASGAPPAADRDDARAYISYGALGRGILDWHGGARVSHLLSEAHRKSISATPRQSVVVIDEIDKAPRDVCNDLLNEIDRLTFSIPELFDPADDKAGRTPPARQADERLRPIVFITSNGETQLPDAFLRRCLYLHIDFPREAELRAILQKKRAESGLSINDKEIGLLLEFFLEIRAKNPEKKPAIAELLDAARIVPAFRGSVEAQRQHAKLALLKLRADRDLFDKSRTDGADNAAKARPQ